MKWSVDEAKAVGGVKSMEMKKINRKYWLMPVIMFSLMLLWHFNCYASNECEHQYGAVTYIWSSDNQMCTAERKCAICSDVESETTTTMISVTQKKNCTLPELATCWVTFENPAFGTQTKESVQTAGAPGHEIVKGERREAGCTADGYEEYWSCNKCHKLFSDVAAKTEIANPVKLPSEGHDLVKSERKEAGCIADGHEAYWQCSKCHRFFADEKGAKQINAPVKLPSEGHDLVKSERKEAGCTADGHEAYWQCSKCHRFFSDEEGNTRISEPKVISKTGHSLKKVEKKEASCTESGYEAYWKCQNETCQRLFSDEGGKTGINQPKEIKATGHDLEKVEKKVASCTESGHEGYWKCQTCEKLFSDETGKTVISESIEIPALGHSLEKIEKKEAGCTESGYEAYWKCQICEKLFSDEAGTDEIVSLDDIQIPAKGHEEGNEWLSDAEKHWKECAVCQEKTEEADHVYVNETDTVCEICGYERTIKSEVPEILEGHNGKWQMNSGKTLSFRSSAPFAEFISVTIDDVVVDEKNYDKAEGSTIITLHPEFLSTLSVGTHTLSIDSASGSATTEFTIEEAMAEPSITETPSVTPTTAPSATTASTVATVTPAPTASPETKAPKTGDESNVAIWMLLLFLSAEGIIVALQKSKKKTR